MITKKQKKVLDYIKIYSDKHEYAPSLEEIRTYFKFASVSTAHYHINKLQQEGYLRKDSNQPRGIAVQSDELRKAVIPKHIKSFSVPVLGAANAGPATLFAEENITGYLKISRNIFNRKDGVFALRVEGNSMNRAKINGKNLEEGDFALIDPEYKSPQNGDYVLSIIDNCANLKKFEKDEKTGAIKLISESTNKIHKPIFVSSKDDFMINGKIINVIKR